LGPGDADEVLYLIDDLALRRLIPGQEPARAMMTISPGASAKTV
jgi:hypothetical protein